MKIRLKTSLPDNTVSLHNLFVDIDPEIDYVVTGLLFPASKDLEAIYLCIADNRYEDFDLEQSDYEPYPVWLPLSIFDVVDSRVPEDWIIGTWDDEISGTIMSFEEWVCDQEFYAKLVEGNMDVQKMFVSHYEKYLNMPSKKI